MENVKDYFNKSGQRDRKNNQKSKQAKKVRMVEQRYQRLFKTQVWSGQEYLSTTIAG